MGAGPLPVDGHRRRPPIPIVRVDIYARDAALAAGASAAEAWLAAVTPSGARRTRLVDAGGVAALRTTLAARADSPGMSVGEVALAVDTGREIAARAAHDGITVLVARAPAGRGDAAARALAAVLTGAAGPVPNGALGALRRVGDATCAVLCGVALGAGEHGLGCVCEGLAALTGAAVAAGIEPDVRPRLIAARPADTPDEAALAAHLGLAAFDADGIATLRP